MKDFIKKKRQGKFEKMSISALKPKKNLPDLKLKNRELLQRSRGLNKKISKQKNLETQVKKTFKLLNKRHLKN